MTGERMSTRVFSWWRQLVPFPAFVKRDHGRNVAMAHLSHTQLAGNVHTPQAIDFVQIHKIMVEEPPAIQYTIKVLSAAAKQYCITSGQNSLECSKVPSEDTGTLQFYFIQ